YQPADSRDAMRSPKLWASETIGIQSNPLTARHVQLESFFWPDGSGTHRATYQLENHPAGEIKMTVPADTRLVTAAMDGQLLEVVGPTGDDKPTIIHLPAGAGSTKLALYFETRGPPLKTGSELTPLALNDLPFLTGEWIIWLPEEYSATGSALANTISSF